jgi:hypothetical protein
VENVGIFYGHLWPFGIIFGSLVYFVVLLLYVPIFTVLVYLFQEKSGNPAV